jgi:prevent-host-death family protein
LWHEINIVTVEWIELRRRTSVKKITVGKFKANCLAILDEVQSKRETVVITKRGKPVAKLVPMGIEKDDIFGFLVGKGKIVGDVVGPALSRKEWGNLW